LLKPAIILFIFSTLISFCANAQQNYFFQHLTAKDGLASEEITGILHDSHGYTWLGTNKGLQKYDGNNFTVIPYGEDYFNTSSLSATVFNQLSEDKTGKIWVVSNGIVSFYDPLSGKINRVQIDEGKAQKDYDKIRGFCKDDKGEVWIVTRRSLYKYNSNSQKSVLWFSLTNTGDFSTNLIFDKIKKGIWVIRNRRILFLNINEKKEDTSFYNCLPKILNNQIAILCWIDSKQNLWISYWNGCIFKINIKSHRTHLYTLHNFKTSKQRVIITANSFIEDDRGIIWLGASRGGLFYYNSLNDQFENIPSSNSFPNSLHYDFDIFSLSKDNEGNIWVGTDKGISIFNPASRLFQTVDENSLVQPFPRTEVTQIFETGTGDILIATWGNGWYIYNRNFELKKHFSYNVETDWWDNRKNLVWSFAGAKDGKIWIGYQYGLLGIYDIANKSIRYINEPGFNLKTIRVIRCDAEGNMWFGIQSGMLGKWDRKKNKFVFYNISPINKNQSSPISDMLICSNGEIWLATSGNGFYRFDPVNERIAEHYGNNKNRLANDSIINSLTLVNDSVIGIATSSKGILLFNRFQKTFISITRKDGLPTNEVFGMEEDKQKNIWINTYEGLYMKKYLDNKIVSFNEEDGLLKKRFTQKIFKLNDGRMTLPASTGFVYFLPENIQVTQTAPKVQFVSFKIFDQSLLIDSLLHIHKPINLPYDQNFITIGYSSPNFMSRNTTRYFYQLLNVDKDWVNAGSRHSATYTGLHPGHYIFKVKCETGNGFPSKNIPELSIYIRPPWWLTWWAYTFYVLVAGAIVYTVYRNRISKLESKQAAQIKIMVATQEEERKRISRDLHDDVGTRLSALKLFISTLQERATQTNNEEIRSLAISSEQFITEVVQDVRQLLLNLSPSVLEDFGYTTAVEGLVNKINETKQLYFHLVVFGMKQRLKKDYELALYRITQELINNVLKHSEAKHVSLQIGHRDEKIILMMEDDGKGFDVSAHKDGYGLHNLESRTKLMKGTITIDSQPGKGTSVLIEIPYNLNQV